MNTTNNKKVLKVPKSDVEVMKGFKSRDKTITVLQPPANSDGEDLAIHAINMFHAAVDD
jgi:hypothetical protein